jgi:hypothetical protein
MAIHDRTASVLALARNILGGIDKSRLETPVQTESLRLLLETLIELGTPTVVAKVQDGAMRSVMGLATAVSEAEKARG